MTYSYSNDEERYHGEFATILDALNGGFSEDGAEVVHVGERDDKSKASDYLDIESMLERIGENAYDHCGDVAENFMMFPPRPLQYLRKTKPAEFEKRKVAWDSYSEKIRELRVEVAKAVDTWADKYGEHPNFWAVVNCKAYSREQYESMMAEAKKEVAEDLKKKAEEDGEDCE